MSRTLKIALALVSIPVLAAIDHATGYEINFFLFYIGPVAAVAWYAGRLPGLATACACAIAWFVVDVLSGRPYSHVAVGVWNGGIRMVVFFMTAFVVAKLRRDQQLLAEANEKLKQTVRELERSAQQIRELQGNVQLVCAWTKRIKSEGRWMSFEEFMARNFNLRFTHGISEEAAEKLYRELGEDPAPSADEGPKTIG